MKQSFFFVALWYLFTGALALRIATNSQKGAIKKQDPAETLVVVLGNHRGGNLAWYSMLKHVVRPWGAHLATFVPDRSRYDENLLTKSSHYVWDFPELEDFGDVIDTMPGVPNSWRDDICHSGQRLMPLWGGSKLGECGKIPSSGSISMVYRWRLYQEIEALKSQGVDYKHVVLTRSDFLYVADIQPISSFSETGVTVTPWKHGGYTDKFNFLTHDEILPSLNITANFLANYKEWWPNGEIAQECFNLETMLGVHWRSTGTPVNLFDHPAFSVKLPTDTTSYVFAGERRPVTDAFNLLVKYPEEFDAAKKMVGGPDNVAAELSKMAMEIGYDGFKEQGNPKGSALETRTPIIKYPYETWDQKKFEKHDEFQAALQKQMLST